MVIIESITDWLIGGAVCAVALVGLFCVVWAVEELVVKAMNLFQGE